MFHNEKKKFIKKRQKEINKNNEYALSRWKRTLYKIERNAFLTFLLSSLVVIIFIIVSNYFFYNPIDETAVGYYNTYISFPNSDIDSARYFFSAVSQSLAALFAISITVLLIYLQISTDKYSIQTVKYAFYDWRATSVASVFFITILYSLFKIAKIKEVPNSIQNNPLEGSIFTVFILSVVCCSFLISFFYHSISGLSPRKFIKNSGKRIRKSFLLALDYEQNIRLKKRYFRTKIDGLANIEERYFFGDVGLQSVITSKRGHVHEINGDIIIKCSDLLSSVSDECKLYLNIPIGRRVSSATYVLAFIECSDEKITKKIEVLIKKAYKIDDKNMWMLEDYTELEPISSLTTKAVREMETSIAQLALVELTDITIEYIKARSKFGLKGVERW